MAEGAGRSGADVVARAPGRVNLIGDHTDHTGGFCLPMAIDRWVQVEGHDEPSSRVVRLISESAAAPAIVPVDVADPAALEPEWARYVAGVVAQLGRTHGWAGTVRSTVPMGAGLSSSAALEVAVALALGVDVGDRLALAQLCRQAEHAARGVPTGLLDQLASVFGVEGHALLLDCTTNEVTPTPLPPSDEVEVVVVPTAARSLDATPYARRVAELRRAEAQIGPLRDARLEDAEGLEDPVIRRRARHVISENGRVHAMAAALAGGELTHAGELMDESHRSLSEDFESSTPQIDALCAELRSCSGVFGVRITGGGWGGSVVALAQPGALAGRGWVVRAVAGASRANAPIPGASAGGD